VCSALLRKGSYRYRQPSDSSYYVLKYDATPEPATRKEQEGSGGWYVLYYLLRSTPKCPIPSSYYIIAIYMYLSIHYSPPISMSNIIYETVAILTLLPDMNIIASLIAIPIAILIASSHVPIFVVYREPSARTY